MENEEETKTPTRREWKQMLEEALEWTLNAAGEAAREEPHEIAAVERVRAFVRKRFAEIELERMTMNDVFVTLTLFITASAQRVFQSVQSQFRAAE